MRTHLYRNFALALFITNTSTPCFAGISVEPFVSVSSTKSIKGKPGNRDEEDEVIKERQTYGLRGSVSFYRIMKFQLGVGTNQLTTTTKTQKAVDEYEEIDYEKDLDVDTSQPDKEVRIKEVQKKVTATLILDPSFGILILRAKAGVVATQRELQKDEEGKASVKYTSPITYKPLAGAGLGVRLGARMYAMAEYSLFFYKFPKTAPFEREVTVSYGVSF